MRNIVKAILIKNSTINIFHNILHILIMLFYLLDKISLCKKTYKIVFKKNAKLNELNHHVYINFNYSIWLMVVSRINLVSNDTRKNILCMIYTYIFLHVIMFVLNIYVLSNSLVWSNMKVIWTDIRPSPTLGQVRITLIFPFTIALWIYKHTSWHIY